MQEASIPIFMESLKVEERNCINALIAELLTLCRFSLRRGYLVYKNVCKACHSVKYLAFREMVGVFMTEEEAKAEAEEVYRSYVIS